MNRTRILPILVMAFVLAPLLAHGQTAPLLEFTAATTTGNGSVIPVLTWKTTPAATTCTAAGSWLGTKAASGTQTLPAITTTANYDLTCTWPNNTATLTWTNPTQNTDGSAYTNPKVVRIRYGTAALPASQTKDIAHPGATMTIGNLTPGLWMFAASAINQNDAESISSGSVSKTIGADQKTESVRISVNPVPVAITDLKVVTP